MKKLPYLLILSGLISAPVFAADAAPAAAPAPDYTLTANVGIVSQYIYRGITQTARNPAIQGGIDFSHSSGFYVGTWGSSISWIGDNYKDFGATQASAGMEWDIYGGYKGTAGPLAYDVGILQYYYPGSYSGLPAGLVKPNTTEVYGALSKDWLSFKVSYVVSNGLFGVDNADGSYYADLSANYPIADTWTLNAHIGYQKYTGTACSTCADNNSLYSYTDYKLGVTKDLGSGWSAMAYYSDTNAKDGGYKLPTANDGKNLGAGQFVVGVSRTF
jgi:uncharacterized protein (TIGR02001 family)